MAAVHRYIMTLAGLDDVAVPALTPLHDARPTPVGLQLVARPAPRSQPPHLVVHHEGFGLPTPLVDLLGPLAVEVVHGCCHLLVHVLLVVEERDGVEGDPRRLVRHSGGGTMAAEEDLVW